MKKENYPNIKKLTKKEQDIFIVGALFGIEELVTNMKGSAGRSARSMANNQVKHDIISGLTIR